MSKECSADRSRKKRQPKGCQGCKCCSNRVVRGKEQFREDQHGCSSIDIEVKEFDGGSDKAGRQYSCCRICHALWLNHCIAALLVSPEEGKVLASVRISITFHCWVCGCTWAVIANMEIGIPKVFWAPAWDS